MNHCEASAEGAGSFMDCKKIGRGLKLRHNPFRVPRERRESESNGIQTPLRSKNSAA
jgi:hypothetical protein